MLSVSIRKVFRSVSGHLFSFFQVLVYQNDEFLDDFVYFSISDALESAFSLTTSDISILEDVTVEEVSK